MDDVILYQAFCVMKHCLSFSRCFGAKQDWMRAYKNAINKKKKKFILSTVKYLNESNLLFSFALCPPVDHQGLNLDLLILWLVKRLSCFEISSKKITGKAANICSTPTIQVADASLASSKVLGLSLLSLQKHLSLHYLAFL